MKINFSLGDNVKIELEREPMPEKRYKAIIGVLLSILYLSLVITVTALCGLPGLIAAMAATFLVSLVVLVTRD